VPFLRISSKSHHPTTKEQWSSDQVKSHELFEGISAFVYRPREIAETRRNVGRVWARGAQCRGRLAQGRAPKNMKICTFRSRGRASIAAAVVVCTSDLKETYGRPPMYIVGMTPGPHIAYSRSGLRHLISSRATVEYCGCA
jgi:hypothetical protein